jgi:hypothetical protein
MGDKRKMTKEELEKEAEVYADDKKHFDGQAQLYIVDGYLAGAEPREKRIAELEKENAELKESGSVICDRLSERIDETVELKNENIGLKNQFTKAKELLERLLITSCNSDVLNLLPNCSEVLRVRVEAEQFLKE